MSPEKILFDTFAEESETKGCIRSCRVPAWNERIEYESALDVALLSKNYCAFCGLLL